MRFKKGNKRIKRNEGYEEILQCTKEKGESYSINDFENELLLIGADFGIKGDNELLKYDIDRLKRYKNN